MNIEEFVNYYLQNYRHDVLLNPYNGLIDFANAFKEKMMGEAVEGQIYGCDGSHWIETDIDENIKGKYGDKVRIIIVKED